MTALGLRAQILGQRMAYRALLQEIDNKQYDTEGTEAEYGDGYHSCLESLKFWAQDMLSELDRATELMAPKESR